MNEDSEVLTELKKVGTRVTEHQFTENQIGGIWIQTMAYAGYFNDVRTFSEIKIRSVRHEPRTEAYGKLIFEGTLEELIAKLAPLPAEEPKSETLVLNGGI